MRKPIAIFEIIGGIVVILTLWYKGALSPDYYNFRPWPNIIISFLFLLFGIINCKAGIDLWRNRNSGYILSLIILGMQILSYQSSTFAYEFFAPFWFKIFMSGLNGGFSIYWGSSLDLIFSNQPAVPPITIGVNLVALILFIIMIFLSFRKLKSQKEIQKVGAA